MFIPSAEETYRWYNLAKDVFADIKGSVFKTKLAKERRYADLFDAVRRTHVDYIRMFVNLRDTSKLEPNNIMEAKKRFLKDRYVLSSSRETTKADASTIINIVDTLSEKRFLTSVFWYFHYEDSDGYQLPSFISIDIKILGIKGDEGSDGAWDTASTLLASKIEDCDDCDEIAKLATLAISQITGRFGAVVQSYTELEGAWQFASPITPSRIFHE